MSKRVKYFSYIWGVILLLIVGIVYEKFKVYNQESEDEKNYRLVKKYLLTESSLAKSKLPILWIYMDYEINARNWPSFFGRNTKDLNQPYVYLTIKSIVSKCSKDFNICLINDGSLENIVPDWNIEMGKVPSPIKEKLRNLACAKILKYYGGLFVPPTFLCLKNLINTYKTNTSNGNILLGELQNKSVTNNTTPVLVSHKFMGSIKNNETINEYIEYLQRMISTDYTAESIFEGNSDSWLYKQVEASKASIIKANLLGVKDSDGYLIPISKLVGNTYVDFDEKALGIFIPQHEFISRVDYMWFSRMSVKQVLESDTIIGKWLLTTYND